MIIELSVDDMPLLDFEALGVEVVRLNNGKADLQFPDGLVLPFGNYKAVVSIFRDYGSCFIVFSNGEMWRITDSKNWSKVYFSGANNE